MDVLLALWLLSVSEADVLPLAWPEQSLTRVCLRQQPCFYLIVRVYTNPDGRVHLNISGSINYEQKVESRSNLLLIHIFETTVT